MCTLLYLDNKYCQSINDLCNVIKKIETNHQAKLFRDVRNAFYNGILEKWLLEGNQNERLLAVKLSELDKSLTDDLLLRSFNQLFVNREITIEKPNFSKFLKIKEVSCEFANRKELVKNKMGVSIGNYEEEISVKYSFEILEKANLTYSVKTEITCEDNVVYSHTDSLIIKTSERIFDKIYTFKIPVGCIYSSVRVYVDSNLVYSWHFARKPVPSYVEDCTHEQKQIIDEFIESMSLVKGETRKFAIFDGSQHKATLTDYYISPLVSSRLRNFGGKDYFFRDDFDSTHTFIEELNRLTGLNFSLPSEAQWELAAINKAIKYVDNEEWTEDKWDPYVKIDSNRINPICRSTSGNIICRGGCEDYLYRRWISRRAFLCFRLVFQIQVSSAKSDVENTQSNKASKPNIQINADCFGENIFWEV